MTMMGVTRFARFFRLAASLKADKDDVKRLATSYPKAVRPPHCRAGHR